MYLSLPLFEEVEDEQENLGMRDSFDFGSDPYAG
jgi:hypothetical protein